MAQKRLRTWLIALLGLAYCSEAQALTLECELGVAFGTKSGLRKTYTLTIDDGGGFVTATSGGTSRRLSIIRNIETDGMRALVLDNGDRTVAATLILLPAPPRLELELGGNGTISQTDLCRELSP